MNFTESVEWNSQPAPHYYSRIPVCILLIQTKWFGVVLVQGVDRVWIRRDGGFTLGYETRIFGRTTQRFDDDDVVVNVLTIDGVPMPWERRHIILNSISPVMRYGRGD